VVSLQNSVTNYRQAARTDENGAYRFNNVPLNSYRLSIAAPGFSKFESGHHGSSTVPMTQDVTMQIEGPQTTTVDVTATSNTQLDLNPASHNDVDQSIINNLPTTGTGLSDLITLSTPGVVADSNGFFHPQGDHAQTSYVVDGQPISDQQSRAFSTQMPENAFQNMEMITGSAAAQYGDKTSLVVEGVTRSGLGKQPFGEFDADYGSFGSVGEKASFGFGGAKLGNFIVINSDRTGRFLDSPEFDPMHDVGNDQTIFDRIDFQPTEHDALHLNLFHRPQLVPDSQFLRRAQSGPAAESGQLQHRAGISAHLRHHHAVHHQSVGAARFRELLPQPRSLRRHSRRPSRRTVTC
jgi:hypothetical protein